MIRVALITMPSKAKQNIILCSGYTPPSTALIERIEKACGENGSVELSEDVSLKSPERDPNVQSIVILDLPNIKQSALNTIQAITKNSADSKIIAIHIYTTKLLIEPLIQAGIHGYMMYEPTVTELREAIASVSNNELYLPPRISM